MNESSEIPERDSAPPSVGQRLALWLVYSPPLSWHAPAARLFGVRHVPAVRTDAAALYQAERDSFMATRLFGLYCAWAVLGVVFIELWAPILGTLDMTLVERVSAAVFAWALATGFPRAQGADIAYAAAVAAVAATALASLAVVLVPLVALLRDSILAASSAISLALHFDSVGAVPDLSQYPRLEYVIGGLVKGARPSA